MSKNDEEIKKEWFEAIADAAEYLLRQQEEERKRQEEQQKQENEDEESR
jgi:hypothetical protein